MNATGSKSLLVTGAGGFLGSGIVDLALLEGWDVRALYRDDRPGHRAEAFVGDICDAALLRKAGHGVGAIIHAAGLAHVFGRRNAKDHSAFNRVNESGTANVLDAALECGVPQVVLVSSVSVYGRYAGESCDESVPSQPRGAYAVSKWLGEMRAIERAATGRCSLSILRFATIYGERDRGNVARLIDALDRRRFIWPGSGQNRKSLIYKEDAARACLRALDRVEPGAEIFNVSATPSTMREIVTAICQALRRPVPKLGIPGHLLKPTQAMFRAIGDPGHLAHRLDKFLQDDVYDGRKFENRFGFYPKVPLREGIRREVDALHAR